LSQVLGETTGVLGAETLARRLLAPMSDSLQALDCRPVTFACMCSRARAASTLEMLHEEDLQAMILEENQAQITCNFCGEQYSFSEGELEIIRRKRQPVLPVS
jgi:molecular chaperone Hsp33